MRVLRAAAGEETPSSTSRANKDVRYVWREEEEEAAIQAEAAKEVAEIVAGVGA